MTEDFQSFLSKKLTRKGRNLSALTVQSYLQTVSVFERWYQDTYHEPMDAHTLTNYDMRQFSHWSQDTMRVQPATWNARRAGLVIFCAWLNDPSLMAGVTMMDSVDAHDIRWLDEQAWGRFVRHVERLPKLAKTPLQAVAAFRNQAICALMAFAGLRVFEVMALHKNDVTLGERSGEVVVRKGKGAVARKVPLGVEARKLIKAWHESRPDGLLFDISKRQAMRIVPVVGRDAGIQERLTCHDLRSTYAKRVLMVKYADGTSIPVTHVQRLLGHARLETTARYIDASLDELRFATENL
jgi:site-specific recombinase XerD